MSGKEKVQIEVDISSHKLHVQHATCPNGHQLCSDEKKIHGFPALKVKIKYKDKEGILYLDPEYGSYDNVFEGVTMPKGGVAECLTLVSIQGSRLPAALGRLNEGCEVGPESADAHPHPLPAALYPRHSRARLRRRTGDQPDLCRPDGMLYGRRTRSSRQHHRARQLPLDEQPLRR